NEKNAVEPCGCRRRRRQRHDDAVKQASVAARQRQAHEQRREERQQRTGGLQEQRGSKAVQQNMLHLPRTAVAGQLLRIAQVQRQAVPQVAEAADKKRLIQLQSLNLDLNHFLDELALLLAAQIAELLGLVDEHADALANRGDAHLVHVAAH